MKSVVLASIVTIGCISFVHVHIHKCHPWGFSQNAVSKDHIYKTTGYLLRFVINITSNIVSSLARLCYCIISASTVDGYYILCYGQCQKQRHNWLAHLAMYKSARVNEARSALESCSVMGTTAIPRYYRGNGDGLSGVPSLLTDLSSCMASCLAEQTALNCCWTVQ